jgi:hypothetical protein
MEKNTPGYKQRLLTDKILVQLYAGLYYENQGKKIIATQLIQEQAVHNLMDLVGEIEKNTRIDSDLSAGNTRIESRFQKSEMELANFIQGYARNYESARAILSFLEKHFVLNRQLAQAVCSLGI